MGDLFLLYVWTRLDAINSLLSWGAVACGAIYLYLFIRWLLRHEERLIKYSRAFMIAGVVLTLLGVLMPSKGEFALLGQTYMAMRQGGR